MSDSFEEKCQDFWLIHDSEKEEVIRLLINEFYDMDGNGCGGCLYIVLDDGNTCLSDVEFSIECAKENNDVNALALGSVILSLTQEQRDLWLGGSE